jgi:putative MFS transporter
MSLAPPELHHRQSAILGPAVIISALGYFVDVFDALLFGFVRIRSLTDLGYSGEALTNVGINIQNWQMTGMVVGGLLSGVLGDRFGRVRVLYLSVFLYSIASILSGLVQSGADYAVYRFIAGVGLAGELGAGVTLVAEVLPRDKRGLGAAIVAAFGLSGAIAAGFIDRLLPDWRHCYFFGGGLGLALLVLRLSVAESGIFRRIRSQAGVRRGRLADLFNNRDRFGRFARSTLAGCTTWFGMGVLTLLAPEFGAARGLSGPVHPGSAIIWFHVGIVLGDVASGLLSQLWRSRLRVMRAFLALQAVLAAWYLFGPVRTPDHFYALHFGLGFAGGFWAVFVTNAAEQFGTNLRATVATAAPSLVRGLLVPIAWAFKTLKAPAVTGSAVTAAGIVGVVCFALAFWALAGLREGFGRSLEFTEEA